MKFDLARPVVLKNVWVFKWLSGLNWQALATTLATKYCCDKEATSTKFATTGWN
jgi:hypothetical protein